MIVEVINLEKLSADGFKQPANNPAVSTPDNITHAQLRYNTFTSSYVIQGTAIFNNPSTFEFEISSTITNTYSLFKLYVSTDGTTYTEKKSYGGTDGVTLSENNGGVYSAVIRQVGTSAPVVSQALINTTGATAVWAREGLGGYSLTFSLNLFNLYNAELQNSMSILDNSGSPIGRVVVDSSSATLNFVTVNTTDISGGAADEVLDGFYFKITFYPL